MKLGMIVNPTKRHVFPRARALLEWLYDKDCELYVEAEGDLAGEPHVSTVSRAEMAKACEVVVVFGGDGTLLNTSHVMAEFETPILGVNSGGLGFLTETTLDEMEEVLENILSGNYHTKKRMMLEGQHHSGESLPVHALNDLVLSRARLGRVIQVAAYVNDEFVTSYVSDGIIVSTPTGSTAYNLSAHGPIIHPDMNAIILNPICPHTLTNRPIILPPDSEIRLEVESEDECILTADGQDRLTNLHRKSEVLIKRSPREVTLVKPGDRDFYHILRTKLQWGGKASP